ncbi:vitamin B12 ABC transporter ATP-binding protein BtuD [Vibrio fluvialis]|uniref:vitamin B12 ABC transporter ATP-binding protein BtuD n=1 Tax=Vibrio fluvialis TaxID=676 RepID=UPI001C9D17EE|nr:vitamin B12 ABC transporter ATP-binding protein BtuD [Vibrio fluvialis]MBY7994664.1 vitamin B12 ABC transporter ATP-binding protein BtuD [Vibrio fluvialis]MBY8102348.1 vitamin B12 ABC transporter ATP-binding protein BtuD [Vibrio fluvialis]MDT8869291.1 vitamin B12 ABC transporter ATP-binding protein BtuD [Vibrio fluvialis]MDT8876944.1 vitamin B12 ABC transporter ATP-binding protein BtuD [Vibrio fluvialis]
MIRIKSLHVESRLLPLSFDCQPGEILHVVGPNGSGKSTLLAALSGVLDSDGDIHIADMDVRAASLSELALHRAYLSQSEKPAFNLDVFQYLALSLPACAAEKGDDVNQAITFITELLNINDKLHRSIHRLSGGEWQRVRLAGSCLQIWPSLNPYAKLLILDEPAAPLDIAQEGLLYSLIQQVAAKGITVIMANHDLNRSLRHADKVLLLRQGVVHCVDTPQNVLTEQNLAQVFETSVKRVEVEGKPYLVFD